jgi:hypothetical protein
MLNLLPSAAGVQRKVRTVKFWAQVEAGGGKKF